MENVETKETITEQGAGAVVEEKDNTALYEKIEEVANKRIDGIVKNILKNNGVEDDEELKSILNGYKQHKANKTKAADAEIENLRRVNAELTGKIKTGEKNAVIGKAAAELGISPDNLKYVEKLADLSNIEKDGQFDVEAVKTAFQSVLEAVPAFKSETKADKDAYTGFVKVGGKKTEQTKDELEANRIRKLMGLSELQK